MLVEGNLGKHTFSGATVSRWQVLEVRGGAHKQERGSQGIWVEDPIIHDSPSSGRGVLTANQAGVLRMK